MARHKTMVLSDTIYKNLPGSDYYVGADGTIYKLVLIATNENGQVYLTRNGKRVKRTKKLLSATYKKL